MVIEGNFLFVCFFIWQWHCYIASGHCAGGCSLGDTSHRGSPRGEQGWLIPPPQPGSRAAGGQVGSSRGQPLLQASGTSLEKGTGQVRSRMSARGSAQLSGADGHAGQDCGGAGDQHPMASLRITSPGELKRGPGPWAGWGEALGARQCLWCPQSPDTQ